PVARLTHVAVAAVDDKVWLRADLPAEVDEFVSPEAVRVHTAPRQIEARRSILDRADTVAPAVARHEVAAGIANDRHLQPAQRIQHVGAQPIRVGHGRAGIIDTAIDAGTQVLRKSSEEVAVKGSDDAVKI